MTATNPPSHPARRTVLSGALALGTGALLASALPAGSAQAATGPVIADTTTWGARTPSSTLSLINGAPDKVIVHHTATDNVTDYSQAHAYALARAMQTYQMDTEHWIDTGQHFTISRGAYITEGRHNSLSTLVAGTQHVESAHCTAQNTVAIGIENEGTYSTVDPRSAQYAVLVDLITYICTQYGLRAYQIYGHRDFNNTECPGDHLYALIPQLRRDVAARIGGDPTGPVWPMLSSGATGEKVRTLQYLLVQHGATLTVDGSFGPATLSAVTAYQNTTHAAADGVAGNQTWSQAVAPLARGASGSAAKAVQSQLTAHGITTTVDGAFGPGTEAGVKSFQTSASLPSDGVVDARTWSRLLG
ncbi:N-acetylmuramoyl-L-alanine amidase [Streptomyces sp. H10-C2]|uniref:peptidoglycan recognition protein family protein n=1 Tax=unclassified Streptomyces TaxID=2593676 RepID=UPI0024B96FAC|nr:MULTISPECIES: N-acetylmuramoyl-L-alanine amidase [unclassified Streptomyces]MDJ0342668.1 N-acetylmuramoyl-L-alanine amidase [Streptomyces sp. PH10-H1]MDJ0372623.1 N-acetylmuramoyl-L-alanine amidase [Streptomyces sp. H10-C2]